VVQQASLNINYIIDEFKPACGDPTCASDRAIMHKLLLETAKQEMCNINCCSESTLVGDEIKYFILMCGIFNSNSTTNMDKNWVIYEPVFQKLVS
jgi:hypothetical protein